jgi:hypothetical protein
MITEQQGRGVQQTLSYSTHILKMHFCDIPLAMLLLLLLLFISSIAAEKLQLEM